jgi:hypothetical protein
VRGSRERRTRRKRLLELLGLVGVLKDEGVEVSAAADLELDLRRTLGGLLLIRKKHASALRPLIRNSGVYRECSRNGPLS